MRKDFGWRDLFRNILDAGFLIIILLIGLTLALTIGRL